MKNKYDIIWDGGGPKPAPHFCREWDGDGVGCYGTNPNHGFDWEEVKEKMVAYYLEKVDEWKNKPEVYN